MGGCYSIMAMLHSNGPVPRSSNMDTDTDEAM